MFSALGNYKKKTSRVRNCRRGVAGAGQHTGQCEPAPCSLLRLCECFMMCVPQWKEFAHECIPILTDVWLYLSLIFPYACFRVLQEAGIGFYTVLFFSFKTFQVYGCFACMCACVPRVCSAFGVQKVLDLLRLELQMFGSCHAGTGNWTWVL